MHTIERHHTEAADLVAKPTERRRKRTWTAPTALAIAVVVATATAVAVSDTEAPKPEPSVVVPVAALQGESYVVAGGQAPSLGSNLRAAPVLSTPAVAAAVPHIVSGGQAPVWNTGTTVFEVEPDPIPVWRPTRDKPGGR